MVVLGCDKPSSRRVRRRVSTSQPSWYIPGSLVVPELCTPVCHKMLHSVRQYLGYLSADEENSERTIGFLRFGHILVV